MIHLLPTDAAAVDHGPESVRRALLPREPAAKTEQATEQRRFPFVGIIEIDEMPLGHDQEVDGCCRADVMEGEQFVVLVDLAARDLPARDSAEQALLFLVRGHRSPV